MAQGWRIRTITSPDCFNSRDSDRELASRRGFQEFVGFLEFLEVLVFLEVVEILDVLEILENLETFGTLRRQSLQTGLCFVPLTPHRLVPSS